MNTNTSKKSVIHSNGQINRNSAWEEMKLKPKFRSLLERENQIQSSELLSMAEPANWNNKTMYEYLEIIYNEVATLYSTTIHFKKTMMMHQQQQRYKDDSHVENNRVYMWNTQLVHRHSEEWIYCIVIPANINRAAAITRHSAVVKYMIYFCEESQFVKTRDFMTRLSKTLQAHQKRNPSFGLLKEHVEQIPSLEEGIPPVCSIDKETVPAVIFCNNVPVCMDDMEGLPIPPTLFNYKEKIIREQLEEAINAAVDHAQKDMGHALLAYTTPSKLNHQDVDTFPTHTTFSLLIELSLTVAPRSEDHCAIRLRYEKPSTTYKQGCYRICSILSLEEAFLAVRILSQPPKGSWLERRLGLNDRSPPSPSSSITAQDSYSSSPSFQHSGGSSNYSYMNEDPNSHVSKMKNRRSRSNSYSFTPPRNLFQGGMPPLPPGLPPIMDPSPANTSNTTNNNTSSSSSSSTSSHPPTSSGPPTTATSDGFLSHRSNNEDDWEISQHGDDWASDMSQTSEPSLSSTLWGAATPSTLAAPAAATRRQRSHSLHSPLVRRTNLSAFVPPYLMATNPDLVQPTTNKDPANDHSYHHHPPPQQQASTSGSTQQQQHHHHQPPPPSSGFSMPIMISPPSSSSSSNASASTSNPTTNDGSTSSHLHHHHNTNNMAPSTLDRSGSPPPSSSNNSSTTTTNHHQHQHHHNNNNTSSSMNTATNATNGSPNGSTTNGSSPPPPLTADQRVAVDSTKNIPADDPIWAYRKWQLLEMYQKIHKDYPKSPELDESSLREEIVYHILNSNWKWKCELCCRFNKSDPKRSHCRFKKTPWKCYFAHGNDDLRQKKKYF